MCQYGWVTVWSRKQMLIQSERTHSYCAESGRAVHRGLLSLAASTTAPLRRTSPPRRLRHQNVRRSQEYGYGGDHREQGEHYQAEPIHHHGGELPVTDDLADLIVLADSRGDEAQLAKQRLQLAMRADTAAGRGVLQAAPIPRRSQTAAEIIVHVQHVGEQGFGGALLQLELLHLVIHQDRLARDLAARSRHAQHPRQPVEEECADLRRETKAG